jgi:hypothetical protein
MDASSILHIESLLMVNVYVLTHVKQDWKSVFLTRIHTRAFFANAELLIKDYASYIT